MKTVRNEWKKIFGNKLLLISMCVICFIPILYAAFFLKSIWDPYGMTQDMPVAVVNKDKPIQYNGSTLDIGATMIEKLKENNQLGWKFVDEEKAQQGLKDNEYYMVITIPENFSRNASTILDKDPEKMELIYSTNGSLNYVSEIIGETAMKQLQKELNENVTTSYTETLFEKLDDIKEGFEQGSDGAKQLNEGIGKAQDGNLTLNKGLEKLSVGALQFKNGTSQLVTSMPELIEGVNKLDEGSTELKKGVKAYTNGVGQANTGINTMQGKNGVNNKQLSQGMQTLADTFDKLTVDVNGLLADKNVLKESIETSIAKIKTIIEEAIKSGQPIDIEAIITEINNEIANIKGPLDQALVTIEEIAKKLNDESLDDVNKNIQQLNTGLQAYLAGANQLQAGLNELNSNSKSLVSGSKQLSDGLSQLSGKIPTLSSGAHQLNKGASVLASGSEQLYIGDNQLVDAFNLLNDGSKTLEDKLGDGAKEISKVNKGEDNAAMFASPINLISDNYTHVENYGNALAPYVLSLALYVGCLVFNFIMPIRKVSIKHAKTLGWWASKVSIGLVSASAMVLIETLVMYFLGINIQNFGLYLLTAFITAYSYMFLIMFLAITLDNPGRFVAMILLILQLAGSGGVFPIQLSSSFFNMIHPYLPMTYSIFGFREALAGGIYADTVTSSLVVLSSIAIISIILMFFSMRILERLKLRDKSHLDNNQDLLSTNYNYNKIF